jgi:hypothetical protein
MYHVFFYNHNDVDSWHDIGRYMCCFVMWGVLCHLTVIKILKCHGDAARDSLGHIRTSS